jgi:transposase
MPPKRAQSSQNSVEQEGRLLLAIQAIKKEEISSIRDAANRFQVPRSTLQRRLRGTSNRAESRANNHKLTQIDEDSLKQWILSMDQRGASPRPTTVQEMANILLAAQGTDRVGKNWVSNFLRRTPELKSRFSRRYDYQRAKQEDPKVIREWFDIVERAITTYGILLEDIYNFDETGFAMGLTATAKVITRAEYYGRKSVLQPGNREWVTAIESISASGWALPPVIIFKGKVYIESWFDGLPGDWRFEVSPNGWTTDEIGLRWLQKLFIPSTNSYTQGRYRLLILDGHGSHLTPQFDQICAENKIIPICMPPHSSHLLQPLDIGCFAVLKRSYGSLIDQKMRLGINHIDKLDFLAAYPQARADAFKIGTIKNSFKAAGLVPINPEPVLGKLNIQLRTPTPIPERPSSQSSIFSPKTPGTIAELLKQASSIKTLLKYRSESPPTPTKRAVNQVIKGCQLAMNSAIFLAHENEQLRAANEKQKQKRRRSNRQIAHLGGLSVQEAQELTQAPEPIPEPPAPAPAPPVQAVLPASAPVRRRLPTCGKCREIGHKANACPVR